MEGVGGTSLRCGHQGHQAHLEGGGIDRAHQPAQHHQSVEKPQARRYQQEQIPGGDGRQQALGDDEQARSRAAVDEGSRRSLGQEPGQRRGHEHAADAERAVGEPIGQREQGDEGELATDVGGRGGGKQAPGIRGGPQRAVAVTGLLHGRGELRRPVPHGSCVARGLVHRRLLMTRAGKLSSPLARLDIGAAGYRMTDPPAMTARFERTPPPGQMVRRWRTPPPGQTTRRERTLPGACPVSSTATVWNTPCNCVHRDLLLNAPYD